MATRRSRDPKDYPSETVRRLKSSIKPTIFLLILAAGYWAIRARQGVAPDATTQPGVGERLAVLDLAPLTGNAPPVPPNDILGHVTLLNFWGTWCPPCRRELPYLAQLRRRFDGQKDFRLLAVSYPALGQDYDIPSLREETAQLLDRLKLDLPTYCDVDSATISALGARVPLAGFPTSVLVDRQGVIRAVWSGYRTGMEIEMERLIGQVLTEER